MDTLRITNLDEIESSQSYKPNSSVLDNIKQRSQAQKDDPTQGISVKNSQVKVESTKLRQLLNNLNTEEF